MSMIRSILKSFRLDLFGTGRQQETVYQQADPSVLATTGGLLDVIVEQILHAATNRMSDNPANPDATLYEFDLPPDVRFIADRWNWVRKRGTTQGLFDALHLIGYDTVQVFNQGGFLISPYCGLSSGDFYLQAITRYSSSSDGSTRSMPWFTPVIYYMPYYGTIQYVGKNLGQMEVGYSSSTPSWGRPSDDRDLIESICRWNSLPTDCCAEIVFVTNGGGTTPARAMFADYYLRPNFQNISDLINQETDNYSIRIVDAQRLTGYVNW